MREYWTDWGDLTLPEHPTREDVAAAFRAGARPWLADEPSEIDEILDGLEARDALLRAAVASGALPVLTDAVE